MFLLALLAGAVGCAPRVAPAPLPRLAALDTLAPAAPAMVGLDPHLPARLDSIVRAALAEGVAPGVALAVGRHGRLVHLAGYGRTHAGQDAAPVDSRTMFDLASLTKVVATTSAAMLLEEQGRLELDRPVGDYLPELVASDSSKAGITVRMLLTHTGGLEAYAPLYREHDCSTAPGCRPGIRGGESYLAAIAARPLRHAPGERTVYSDWDLVLLQLVIERITGRTLDRFAAERIFQPLGMEDTQFSPVFAPLARVAATSVDTTRGGLIHGVVHDGNAWALGGVAGHAGLFSSARDLAVFAQTLLNGGAYGGVRLLRPETVARWTARQGKGSSRALGWDTPSGRSSAGRYSSARAFGHTGFTGTSLWVDPERGIFVVLLTNRVHVPGDNQRHVPLRRAVVDAVQEAVLDAPLINWETTR